MSFINIILHVLVCDNPDVHSVDLVVNSCVKVVFKTIMHSELIKFEYLVSRLMEIVYTALYMTVV